MSVVLPGLLLAGVFCTLAFGLHALWESLRSAFGAVDVPDLQGSVEDASRAQLLDEKQTLLEAIRDLKFDLDAGKLSQVDFDRVDERMRARAKDVLRRLDTDIERFRARAERMVRKRLEKTDSVPYRDARGPLIDDDDGEVPRAKRRSKKARTKSRGKKRRGTQSRVEKPSPTKPQGPTSTQHCSECGAGNDADAVFCKKCGSAMSTGEEE